MKLILLFVLCISAEKPTENHKFAANLYKAVAAQNKGNILLSPLSLQISLALCEVGAKNITAFEIQGVLNTKPGLEQYRRLFKKLKTPNDYALHLVNKIFVQNSYTIKKRFRTLAQQVFDTEIENIDFVAKQETAQKINDWVLQKTNNKIGNLVNSDLMSNATKLLSLNAITLRGNWSIPFESYATRKQIFNENKKVDMMSISEESFYFYEKNDASFLELPIRGNATFTVVVPKNLTDVEDKMEDVLAANFEKRRELFNVVMPKFRLESKVEFKSVLRSLGVLRAFQDGDADFSGIAGEKGELFVQEIVQKSYLDVNESGLEAAAATFVVKIVNRNQESARDFIVDRPFLFFVKVEGVVLFVGRVVVP